MKNIRFIVAVMFLPLLMVAQDGKKTNFGIKFSGFVRNDVIYNSRQVVAARGENDFILAPEPVVLDKDKKDINAVPNYNIVSFTSRIRGKITGPEAFGAKTSGLIEADFLGSTGLSKFDLRLRHAIIKLDWSKAHVLVGQYWHPMFVTDCFPKTVSFGAGITFNPFARNPQIRYTYNFTKEFSVATSILSQGQYRSKGNPFSQQNSGIPESNIHLQYKSDLIVVGVQFDYQVLRPRLVSDSNYVTKTTVSSKSYLGYLKLKLKPIRLSLYGIYGQNNDNMVMMGGYSIKNRIYSKEEINKNIVEYIPHNTATVWADFETTGKKIKLGLFLGYSQNMGASDSIVVDSYTGRWGDVNALMRIAPRVVYISNTIKVGFELEYSAADYAEQKLDEKGVPLVGSDIGGISKYGKITNYTTANNIKFIFSMAYIY